LDNLNRVGVGFNMDIDLLRNKVFGKKWANFILKGYLDILYSDSWVAFRDCEPKKNLFVLYRKALCENACSLLEDHGFWWQARVCRAHFHRWLKKNGGLHRLKGGDTRSRRESGESEGSSKKEVFRVFGGV